MSTKPHIELLIEDENGSQQVAYPFVNANHVSVSNGMSVGEMLDGDVSMPSVTHDTTAIKVGVGDIDVSSSVVDSTVNMTIKGQTYQNILPDPSLRNKMVGKSMQRLNEGYDSIETIDGVSKSAILKGQTLVNLANLFSFNDDVTTSAYYIDRTVCETNRLKLNTPYLFLFKPNVSSNLNDYTTFEIGVGTRLDSTQAHPSVSGERYNFDGIKHNQWNYIKITFTDFKGYKYLTVRPLRTGKPDSTKPITYNVKEGLMLIEYQEGMENWNIPYFEGMTSCKMPVLQTVGKNLFDVNNVISGHITESAGFTPTDNNAKTIDWFYCKPNTSYTVSGGNRNRWILCNANGEETFIGGVGGNETPTIITLSDTVKFRCYVGYNAEPIDINNVQLEEGSVATTFESHKTNILSTPEEVVLRSLPSGVCDTLNLNTGEYVQRIGEYIITGNGKEVWNTNTEDNCQRFSFYSTDIPIVRNNNYDAGKILITCDKLRGVSWGGSWDTLNTITTNNGSIYIQLPSGTTMEQAKALMTGAKIQYKLETPIIKTVDLSSHGNWEKVVLNGSENWHHESSFTHNNLIEFKLAISNGNMVSVISDRFATGGNDVERVACTAHCVYIRILKSKVSSLDEFKAWLQQNPVTVWYQTTTTQANSIKEMLSFSNGHIQLSSGADNSLIPTLDYQVKTSNSYVMDLMKANTRYTMKAKSASGTFTIDGTSYGAGTNGTFTTPSSMTNKLLVMSSKTNEEVMIIEGDVTSKTIPYFKGIKSAFEGEDKIEVLSTGKNLFDGAFEKGVIDVNGNLGYSPFAIRTVNYISVKSNASYHINLPNLEPFESLRIVYVHEYDENFKVLGETQVSNRNIYTSKSATKFIKINTHTAHDLPVDSKMIVCENSTLDKQYEPYKSNSTKIPLLSPLKSLPNGVCDELIIDRLNHKAKLIQRIAYETYIGEESWNCYKEIASKEVEGYYLNNKGVVDVGTNVNLFSQPLRPNGNSIHMRNEEGVGTSRTGSTVRVCLNRDKLYPLGYSATGGDRVGIFKQWLSQNPLTVLYELATPIITEIDLEGYPYVYKDGHIFFNSDVAPTTQITYSINQAQQIESANENLQRHEKEISHLQKLIAQYIQVEYESTLLSLKI